MYCPSCGRYISSGSALCNYCGQHIEKGKRNKKVIAFFLVVVLGLSLLYFLQYETENADTLVKAAKKEIERGREHLMKVESQLRTFDEMQFETTDSIQNQRDSASQQRDKVQALLPLLDEAEASLGRAEKFLEKTQNLRLPSSYRESVNQETEQVNTYREYVAALRTLATHYATYYSFAEHYFAGEQHLFNLMVDMDRGNTNLESDDYTFAYAAYESALQQLTKARGEYVAASKLIDFSFMNNLLSDLDHLEKALYNLSEAAHQLELGNTENANFLAALGTKEAQLIEAADKYQVKAQVSQWYALQVRGMVQKIETLKREIEEREKVRK